MHTRMHKFSLSPSLNLSLPRTNKNTKMHALTHIHTHTFSLNTPSQILDRLILQGIPIILGIQRVLPACQLGSVTKHTPLLSLVPRNPECTAELRIVWVSRVMPEIKLQVAWKYACFDHRSRTHKSELCIRVQTEHACTVHAFVRTTFHTFRQCSVCLVILRLRLLQALTCIERDGSQGMYLI